MLQRPSSRPGPRSPFAAAFLSFLFPGLGQAYAGFGPRALAFAALPVLIVALVAGLLVAEPTRRGLLAQLTSPTALLVLLALNAALAVYRVVAVVDAYRAAAVASSLLGTDSRGLSRPSSRTHPLSALGLAAVVAVLAVGHVAAARYNLIAYDLVTGIGGGGPEPSAPIGSPDASPTGAASPTAFETALPTASQGPPWNGTDRLNILLIGSDTRPDIAGHHFTDTLIVASIDPATRQVAMLSLPRDTVRVPLPARFPARAHFAGGVYPDKINGLWLYARANPRLFPGNDRQRGYEALKGALGELYGLDVRYYVEVDFRGFRQIVDTLGGVNIDVQLPVSDDAYPLTDTKKLKLYIPPGIQHMDGDEALAYARARHKSTDFDRAQRQQRVIVSLRQQTDLATLLAPGRLEALVAAFKQTVKTDIPPDLFPRLVGLGQAIDLSNMRSLVFTPPVYQVECLSCYSLTPKVEVIRRAVRNAFTLDQALESSRAKVAEEGARVWVLNGSGRQGQATDVAAYLAYRGLDAEVPATNGGRADRLTYTRTVVTVYNGAEAELGETIRVLEDVFGVEVVTGSDPKVRVDVIVITGSRTPTLTPPPD